ncbi:AAA family ATPase [Fontibacter flavus]|uniref:AAA family ATPase n=1 Tax=Fontibacter flavus TaxID=654838 RepID=A0ABV6FU27_9BACT
MENSVFRKAERKQAKIKIGLQGPSGSGKTTSALLLAYGLVGDWSKVAVIDSENGSADLYSHLGDYNVLGITAPYTPEKYIQAIHTCYEHGMEAIILDSISHEWEGEGGILDIHSKMAGNSFQNWSKVTPRHNAFVNTILNVPVHVISTIRSKQDYVMAEKNGKAVPEKVGLKGVTRDGMDYEFTVVFDIDIKHQARTSKDRTGLFNNTPDFMISAETGDLIRQWCEQGKKAQNDHISLSEKIEACDTLEDLYSFYESLQNVTPDIMELFVARKKEIVQPKPIQSNGKSNLVAPKPQF